MNLLKKIAGAAGALLVVELLRWNFGTSAALVALCILLVGWCCLHLYARNRFNQVYRQFQQLDPERKAQTLTKLDPEIRKDIEERIAKEEKS